MDVSNIMSRNVITCRPEETLSQAVGRMWDHDIGCLPVVDASGHVVAVVTDRDACMAAYTQGLPLSAILVSSAMSHGLHACLPSDPLAGAERVMRAHQIRRMPVINGEGHVVGMLSLNDLAREAAREAGRKHRQLTGDEVSATLAAICEPRDSASLLAQ